jgi:cell division protein FtsQ
MARKSGSTILQEELYPQADEPVREEVEDQRLLDLDVEQESPFLRGQKRVSVRRGSLPKKTATRLTWVLAAAGIVFACGAAVAAIYHYGEHSWRFRVESSDDIEVAELQGGVPTDFPNVTRSQVMEVMGGDIGRNIFFIPLTERQKQLEQIPWVESASVMRFVPNRLRIVIEERTPVAFARVGSKICLISADGTLMDLPTGNKKKYSYPVILGMNSSEPHSTREARMKVYNELVSQLDSGGAHYSQDLSEVDLSDSDDVKVLANDPGGEVMVHLGPSDFLDRYKIFVSHVRDWRQQFERLDSVDLRYDNQIIVNPDSQAVAKAPSMSVSAVKTAMAAGVKPAVLIHHDTVSKKAVIGPVPVAHAKTPAKPVTVKKKDVRHRKAVLKRTKGQVKPAAKPVAKSHNPAVGGGVTNAAILQPTQGNTITRAGNKPSPAIPKGQEP